MNQKQHTKPVTHIVRVHRPQLSEEERAKRIEAVRKAAVNLVLAAERAGV